MSTLKPARYYQRWRKSLILLGIVGLWSVAVGWGMTNLLNASSALAAEETIQLGQEYYLKQCSSCHIPIPPEVLPTESWEELLEKHSVEHYGTRLPRIFGPALQLMWSYVSTYSRSTLPNEAKPLYVTNSRYFKALHPEVELPERATHQTCLGCHPGAKELNYRRLSSEWEGGAREKNDRKH